MKSGQARKLIADLMQWPDEQATQEFKWLELMTRYKFDHYQGYGPGRRFYVTLVHWLAQFDPTDRATAYELLRQHTMYVSTEEMHHLVSQSGPLIEREMRRYVAKMRGIEAYEVDEDRQAAERLRLLKARTLYVGISDGARIDVFRRFNEGAISNEQVVGTAEISAQKWRSLHDKLARRLSKAGFKGEQVAFEWVCLIDDFTGSAFSCIRRDRAARVWDGKIAKFANEARTHNDLPLASQACIHVHHYLASARAQQIMAARVKAIAGAFPDLEFKETFVYVIPRSEVLQQAASPDLLKLLKRYYDPGIEDGEHITANAALGYRKSGLALVLEHNTPNNSAALLWARSKSSAHRTATGLRMAPLFPRRQRHSDTP